MDSYNYNNLTKEVFEQMIKDMSYATNNQPPSMPSIWLGIEQLKHLYIMYGRKKFKSIISAIRIITNMDGFNYIESLKLDKPKKNGKTKS